MFESHKSDSKLKNDLISKKLTQRMNTNSLADRDSVKLSEYPQRTNSFTVNPRDMKKRPSEIIEVQDTNHRFELYI